MAKQREHISYQFLWCQFSDGSNQYQVHVLNPKIVSGYDFQITSTRLVTPSANTPYELRVNENGPR